MRPSSKSRFTMKTLVEIWVVSTERIRLKGGLLKLLERTQLTTPCRWRKVHIWIRQSSLGTRAPTSRHSQNSTHWRPASNRTPTHMLNLSILSNGNPSCTQMVEPLLTTIKKVTVTTILPPTALSSLATTRSHHSMPTAQTSSPTESAQGGTSRTAPGLTHLRLKSHPCSIDRSASATTIKKGPILHYPNH